MGGGSAVSGGDSSGAGALLKVLGVLLKALGMEFTICDCDSDSPGPSEKFVSTIKDAFSNKKCSKVNPKMR